MSHMPPLAKAVSKSIRALVATLDPQDQNRIEEALKDFYHTVQFHGDAGHVAFMLFQVEFDQFTSPYNGHFKEIVIDPADLELSAPTDEPELLPQVDEEL